MFIAGSETWPLKVGDMQRMTRTERSMIRLMCGVSLKETMEFGPIETHWYLWGRGGDEQQCVEVTGACGEDGGFGLGVIK